MALLVKAALSFLILDSHLQTINAFSEPTIHIVGEIYLGETAEWECRYAEADEGNIKHVSIYREECFVNVPGGENKGERVVKFQNETNDVFVLEGAWVDRTVTYRGTDTAFYVTLSDVIYEDEENMCCCVSDQSNGSGRLCSDNLKHDVYVYPTTNPTITDSTVIEDVTSRIQCKVDSFNPPDKLRVYWDLPNTEHLVISTGKHSDENEDGYTYNTTGYLDYTFSKSDHEQSIKCVIKWLDENDDEIDLGFNSEAKLEVHYKPGKADIKVIHPSSGKVDIHDEVELQCELDSDKEGNPEHTKYAFTNGSWTSDKQELNKITASVQSVDPVYTCYAVTESKAESSEGTDLNGVSSDPASYEVYYPADVTYPLKDSPRTLTPMYTDTDFAVLCEAVGYPKPEVRLGYCTDGDCVEKDGFTKDQRDIAVDYDYDVTEGIQVNFTWGIGDMEVTCENVNYYDGEYVKCFAKNSDTDGSPSEDEADRYVIETRYPPLWKGEDKFAEFGEKDVQLKCDVCAYKEDNNDNVRFKWFRNGSETSDTDDTYTISEVTEKEFYTLYECEATNSVGTETYEAPLIESGPPRWSSEELVILANVSSIAATLSWIIGPDGNNPPISYSIWAIDKSTNVVYKHETIQQQGRVGDNMTHTVTGLNGTTDYEFILGASNTREDGNNEADKNITESASTAERPEVEIDRVTFTETEMTVTWTYTTGNVELFSNGIEVGVRVKYWMEGDNPNWQSEYYPDTSAIPASEEIAIVPDEYRDAVYNVELLIYENGLLSESSADTLVSQESGVDDPPEDGSSMGLIIGLVALLIILLIVSLILIMFLKVMPARKARTESESDRSEVSVRPIEQPTYFMNPAVELEEDTVPTAPEHIYANEWPRWSVSVEIRPSVTSNRTVEERLRENPTRTLSEDGKAIYIAVDFPKYRPPKPGQPVKVHSSEDQTVYSDIDFTKKAPKMEEIEPAQPPEYKENEEEEEVWGYLPDGANHG